MRIIIICFLFAFVSCKEVTTNNQSDKLQNNQDSSIVKKTIANNNTEKYKNEEKTDTLFKKLFNTPLIGLSLKKDKKYWIDFKTICMCDSPSLLLNAITSKAYLYNYCRLDIPPKNKEPFLEYKIDKIIKTNQELKIVIESESNLILKFNKTENDVYNLVIDGEFSTDYIGNTISSFFTPNPNSFEKEDCGDFEG
ncbi:hypothetical protein [Olleya sp. Bg11-27]|uniref:hypothetical protein n=1 Tax=Olleya sp. Bg11-27 TaxID=2058135 RepID=UPI000C305AC1|nr:hypothetical protein [Olleya sp. Bg11-27]AUC76327.1 hypothetical protein CW732_11900 [Olleya sp. Bg11-27]